MFMTTLVSGIVETFTQSLFHNVVEYKWKLTRMHPLHGGSVQSSCCHPATCHGTGGSPRLSC